MYEAQGMTNAVDMEVLQSVGELVAPHFSASFTCLDRGWSVPTLLFDVFGLIFDSPVYHKRRRRLRTVFPHTNYTKQIYVAGAPWTTDRIRKYCHISIAYLLPHILGFPEQYSTQ